MQLLFSGWKRIFLNLQCFLQFGEGKFLNLVILGWINVFSGYTVEGSKLIKDMWYHSIIMLIHLSGVHQNAPKKLHTFEGI